MTAERKKWLEDNWSKYKDSMPHPLSLPSDYDINGWPELAQAIISTHPNLSDLKSEMEKVP